MHRIPEPEWMDDPQEAEVYARADFAEVNARFVQRLLELVEGASLAGPPGRVLALDVGTGPGDIPVRVLRERPGWRVVGLEASWAMLGFARRALQAAGLTVSFALIRAVAAPLPLADASVEVVFSNSLLHHLRDPLGFWIEVKRVVRPGGLVLVRDLARPGSIADAARIVRAQAAAEPPLLQQEFYRSLLAAYTPAEVRQQLLAAGLGHLAVARVTDRHLDVIGRR